MRDETKEITLKVLIVIGTVLLLLMLPVLIIIGVVIHSTRIAFLIMAIYIISFFAVGILFIILLFIFGGLKQKKISAEKIPVNFRNYDTFMSFLHSPLAEHNYFEQKSVLLKAGGEIRLYIRPERKILECFVIIRVFELSDELIELANDSITDILSEYTGSVITEDVNMISVFCVDCVNPVFQKLLNSNLQQGIKNGRFLAGISFGENEMFLSRQKGGFAIQKYKKLRRAFLDIMRM